MCPKTKTLQSNDHANKGEDEQQRALFQLQKSRVQVSSFDSMNRMCPKTKTQQSNDHADKGEEQQRALFQKARDHLDPGPLFRFVTYFYAERKIAVFLSIHAICTLVIWGKLQIR
jgi:hypothetical protein